MTNIDYQELQEPERRPGFFQAIKKSRVVLRINTGLVRFKFKYAFCSDETCLSVKRHFFQEIE